MKKILGIVAASVVGLILVLNLTFAAVNYQNPAPVTLFGWKVYLTSTDTMGPYLKDKAFVVVKRTNYEDIKVTDVVDYQMPDMAYTIPNRVKTITPQGLITQGDAVSIVNNYFVTGEQVYGKVVFKSNITANFLNEIGTVGGIFKWIILPAACITLFFVLKNLIQKKMAERKRIYDDEEEARDLEESFSEKGRSNPSTPRAATAFSVPFQEDALPMQSFTESYGTAPFSANEYGDGSAYDTAGRTVRSRYEADQLQFERNQQYTREGRSVRSRYDANPDGLHAASRYDSNRYRGGNRFGQEDEPHYNRRSSDFSDEDFEENAPSSGRYSASRYGSRDFEEDRASDYMPRQFKPRAATISPEDEEEETEGAHVRKNKSESKADKSRRKKEQEKKEQEKREQEAAAKKAEAEEAKSGQLAKRKDLIPDVKGGKKPEYSIVIDFVSPDVTEESPAIRVRMLDKEKNTMAMTTFSGDQNLVEDASGLSEIHMRLVTPNSFDLAGEGKEPLAGIQEGGNRLVPTDSFLATDGLKGLRLAMGSVVFDLEYSSNNQSQTAGFEDYVYQIQPEE